MKAHSKLKLFLASVAVFALAACQSSPEPMTVVNSWQAALNQGDIDTTLSYLAEDATVTIIPAGPDGDGVYNGHAEIRGWYETIVAGKGIATLSGCQVASETVTCLDTYADEGLKAMGVATLEGEWVATVREGKIQSYTFTTTDESLAGLMAAVAAAQATPTPIPPTATSIPPTATSAPPTATFSPEVLAAKPDDVIGVWQFNFQGDKMLMEFTKDGFVNVGWEGDRTGASREKYIFENSQLHFPAGSSAGCDVTLEAIPETAYEVYVAKQGDQPVQLRFVLVGDDLCANRKESLANKTLLLAP